VLGVAVIAGCGYSRPAVPDLSAPARPIDFRTLDFRTAGVALTVPMNWLAGGGKASLVSVISSGPAIIALWRYDRPGATIAPPSELASTRDSLLASIRNRDPSFKLIASAVTQVGSAGAVELDGLETIGGHRRRVRSEHIYLNGAELVLDEYAPVALFRLVDHEVFSPVRKSLRLLNTGAAA
jgi:hypothetical protein